MGSGGAGRGQGRKTDLSKEDNTKTPSISSFFKPVKRDSSTTYISFLW
jgi:hypothetical protein